MLHNIANNLSEFSSNLITRMSLRVSFKNFNHKVVTNRKFAFKDKARCFSTSGNDKNSSKEYDIVVVGGGIVGVASAREILVRHPKLKVAIVEKETKLAQHQTGHNSGVIHAGIYYKPGSLKAKLCVEGLHLTYKFTEENGIPCKKVGKLIVATNDLEVTRLNDLHERGIKNKVPGLQVIDGKDIKQIEPNCTGVKALWSPETGIVDWAVVTEYFGKDVKKMGGDIFFNFKVNGFRESSNPDYPVLISSENGQQITAKYSLTCAGLYSDKVARLSGCSPDPKIIPFRGEYLLLNKNKSNLVRGNIYPVPDPRFPFLGVHYTPRINEEVWLGPNAVLAFKREGYRWHDINIPELIETLLYPGFQKIAFKYFAFGVSETVKSTIISLQVKDLKKFIPQITRADVKKGPAGVRAQALDRNGNLVDDFVFDKGTTSLGSRILHCRNAPSPAATSSMAIAKMIVDRIETEFNIRSMNK